MRRAIAALPEDLRIALTLAEYEDRSMADIAEITQSSIKAVESRLYRARKDLRSSLAERLKLCDQVFQSRSHGGILRHLLYS